MFAARLLEEIFRIPFGALLADEGHADFNCAARLIEAVPFRVVSKKMLDELNWRVRRDNLTRLLSRNGFDLEFPDKVRQAQRNGNELSIVELDLDYFKQRNDGPKGHLEGDRILKGAADVISRVLGIVSGSIRKPDRSADMAMRFGGEEILLIIEAPREIAEAVAVRALKSVEKELSDELGPVTMSAGVACIDVRSISAAQLAGGAMLEIPAVAKAFKEADICLANAKKGGRNCLASIVFGREAIVYKGAPRSPVARHPG